MTLSTRLAIGFTVLGLAVGAVVALGIAWAVRAPKAAPSVPTLNINITSTQLLKRLGPPTNIVTASSNTNGYTIIQYQSHDRSADGSPDWVANVGVK
jgi:hypothetical protein